MIPALVLVSSLLELLAKDEELVWICLLFGVTEAAALDWNLEVYGQKFRF